MLLSCSKKALLRETTSKNIGGFYCLNCLHSYRTKNKLESHKKDFCVVIMPSEDTKILEFNQYRKSDKVHDLLSMLILNLWLLKK